MKESAKKNQIKIEIDDNGSAHQQEKSEKANFNLSVVAKKILNLPPF